MKPGMEKLTRRQLGVLATASLAIAQTPPAPDTDLDKAARDSHSQNSAILAKFALPMQIEPAFQFKA